MRLFQAIRFHRYTGQWDQARELADQFTADFLEPTSDWPDLTNVIGAGYVLMVAALADLHDGSPDVALERFRRHFPDWDALYGNDESFDPFRPEVIAAALLKQTGESEQARQLLTRYLESFPSGGGQDGGMPGLSRFAILAFLGRADEAIEALQWAVSNNRYRGWATLPSGGFDPDYAAVTADPRFQAIYFELGNKVAAMRRSFFENPEIPGQYSLQ